MTEQTFGSKAQVWHGTAKKTTGGLSKSDLMKNKHGRIVSRRKHNMGKKSIKHLRKMGYIAKKGKFTLFHKGHKGSRKMRGGVGSPMGSGEQLGSPFDRALVASGGRRRSRKMRGGAPYGNSVSPTEVSGMGMGSGVALQFVAGNAG